MNILERFKEIDTFIFDVDGVFTDGNLLVNEEGGLLRTMNVRDGLALKTATKNGFQVVIITGGSCPGVKKRFENLGVDQYYSGVYDKISLYEELLKEGKIKDNQRTLYIGDDRPDVPVIDRVGLGCCPSDAIIEAKNAATYISPYAGGQGCVRDILEKVFKLRGIW